LLERRKAASHGCIRMGKRDVEALFELVRVPSLWQGVIVSTSDGRARDHQVSSPGGTAACRSCDHVRNSAAWSVTVRGSLFRGADLRRAIFDSSVIEGYEFADTDFRDAELGGISLTGASVGSIKVEGARFSIPTNVSRLLRPICSIHSWSGCLVIPAM
jgi:hypothetical protein